MTEFQELVKDAPIFASMERGELVAYAYAMYAAGAKTEAENAKLREQYETVLADYRSEVAKLRDENARLCNEVDNLLDFEHLTSVAVAYAGCDECGEYKQTMLRLFAENAKLQSENERLRERLRKVWNAARLLQANGQIEGMRITDEFRAECEADFAELGVDA